jgi:DNA polymerase-3 subunit delta
MPVTYDSVEKSVNTKLEPVYLFYGEEHYLIDTLVKKIKKNFGELLLGINYVVLDESNIDNLIQDIEMPAFGYDKKLILVKNSGLFKKDGRKKTATPLQERIIEYFNNNYDIIEDSCIIVFVEETVDKNAVYEAIEKKAIVCSIDFLKPIQLVARLKKICSMYKVNVDDSTLNYLIEMVGINLQNLINEIRKLIEYAGEGNTITKDAVDELAIKQIESVIFDLTDNLGNKQIGKAIEVLDNLIYQKEPLQRILVTLYTHFKRLYLCSLAVNNNMDVVSVLGLKPNQTFLVSKYKKQASYFKLSQLRNLLREFVDLDYNSKNGNIDIDVGLRSILCSYCS